MGQCLSNNLHEVEDVASKLVQVTLSQAFSLHVLSQPVPCSFVGSTPTFSAPPRISLSVAHEPTERACCCPSVIRMLDVATGVTLDQCRACCRAASRTRKASPPQRLLGSSTWMPYQKVRSTKMATSGVAGRCSHAGSCPSTSRMVFHAAACMEPICTMSFPKTPLCHAACWTSICPAWRRRHAARCA